MTGKEIITFENVSCSFLSRRGRMLPKVIRPLKDINFRLYSGETVGVIGSNGSGKSTLLQLLSRVIVPTSGTSWYADNLSVSLLTLHPGVSPELTGRENALLGAMMLGYTKREALERIDKIINFAELGRWIDEPLKYYSSGMMARLGFAVTLEMRANVILIDELLGVGDAYFVKKSSDELQKVINSGATVVLVSHSTEAIRSLCSRVYWIHDGATVAVGNPREVTGAYDEWLSGLDRCAAGSSCLQP